MEQDLLKKAREEIDERYKKGEMDLTIRYINAVPTITQPTTEPGGSRDSRA